METKHLIILGIAIAVGIVAYILDEKRKDKWENRTIAQKRAAWSGGIPKSADRPTK